jgi:hypothetical protein
MFLLLFQHFEKRQCHYRNDGYFFPPGQKMQEIY